MTFTTRTDTTRDDWQTPIEIVHALGRFDLDPCANIDNPKRLATCGYTEMGLERSWTEARVWVNPPYGREVSKWMRKLARHGNGIALIVPRMGAQWLHREVLPYCSAILFLSGRVSFLGLDLEPVDGNNADSMLVSFGDENADALKQSRLAGEFWDRRAALMKPSEATERGSE